MSEVKHTPGPWRVRGGLGGHINGAAILAESGLRVAGMPNKADRPIGQKEADAALISAAPDLLEALKACHSAMDRLMGDTDWPDPDAYEVKAAQAAMAAIAKAEGQP